MGTTKNMKQMDEAVVQGFCDDVYTELEGMRLKLLALVDELGVSYGEESTPFSTYKRHLMELADQVEWKLQILSHACPYDWKGSVRNVESVVSVKEPERTPGPEFSGGYIGG